jgi:hypothetical protein
VRFCLAETCNLLAWKLFTFRTIFGVLVFDTLPKLAFGTPPVNYFRAATLANNLATGHSCLDFPVNQVLIVVVVCSVSGASSAVYATGSSKAVFFLRIR